MSFSKRLIVILLVLIPCVGCDQVTKSVARSFLPEMQTWSFLGDTFRLQLAHNQGAFLSLGASLPEPWRMWLLVFGVGLVLAAFLGYALLSRSAPFSVVLGISLVFAGGVSNLADRIASGGHVVDFMNIGIGPLRTGIFNVADIAITAGFLLFAASMFADRKELPAGQTLQ